MSTKPVRIGIIGAGGNDRLLAGSRHDTLEGANGDDTRFGALAWRDQPSGETPMSQRCARKTNTA